MFGRRVSKAAPRPLVRRLPLTSQRHCRPLTSLWRSVCPSPFSLPAASAARRSPTLCPGLQGTSLLWGARLPSLRTISFIVACDSCRDVGMGSQEAAGD